MSGGGTPAGGPKPSSPLAWDTTDARAAFEPEDWLRWCERVQGRRRPVVPPLTIQSVLPRHLELIEHRYGAVRDDFTMAGHPVALFEHRGVPMALGLTAKGSYSAGGLDELIAMGARTVICLGACATLVPDVAVGELVLADSALRDEGVSPHYLPASRYVESDAAITDALLAAGRGSRTRVHRGRVWTTSAHFRQSLTRLRQFRSEGCIGVNNEASIAFAVGRARRIRIGSLLQVGDSLADERFRVPCLWAGQNPDDLAAVQLDIALTALVALAEAEEPGPN